MLQQIRETARPVLTANALFSLSLKLSYVLFILARDHLGKLVFAGDGKISFEICSTQFPTYFFSKYVRHISLT